MSIYSDLICRAHQVVEDGYEFFAKRQLVTLFSAPNYEKFDNAGGMMSVDENLMCSFQIFTNRVGSESSFYKNVENYVNVSQSISSGPHFFRDPFKKYETRRKSELKPYLIQRKKQSIHIPV